MLKKLVVLTIPLFCSIFSSAQLMDPFVHKGEIGVSVGLGHYFGDLNITSQLRAPKFAAGAFFRKQISDYVAVRVAGNYAFLGFSDAYSPNAVYRRRNLSFNTNVYELSVMGDFNFFKFHPLFEGYHYTPYVSIGLGVFSYDPYTYLNGTKYFLRPLGTEGQGSALYPDRKQYSSMAFSIPLGVGFKYAFNENINAFAEFCYRLTNTDYLDDVSTTYAPDAFPPLPGGSPSIGFLLQDRSYERGTPIGVKGRQRGNSTQKDAFATFQIGVSFNLSSYRCPNE